MEMVIINTASVDERDCLLSDGVHIAPGAVYAGVKVNNNTLIGANSVINPNNWENDYRIWFCGNKWYQTDSKYGNQQID